jgi:uncharacterized membrane protein YphA (DoxX/SURF4 family)
MKFLVQFSRVIVGLLFILSGMLKLNDPCGFSYKLAEYFSVFTEDVRIAQDSIVTSITVNEVSKTFSKKLQVSDTALDLVITLDDWESTPIDSVDSIAYSTTLLTVFQNGKITFSDSINSDANGSLGIFVKSSISNEMLIDQVKVNNGLLAETFSINKDIRSYVRPNGRLFDLFQFCSKYTLFIAIFFSWLEAILGFALLLGWQARFTTSILLLITVFFTFLTWYSWIYDKVTDCGCFGEALPMSPKESFFKNVIIIVLGLFLMAGSRRIKPVFSNPFGVKVLTILTMLLVGFSLYTENYLPVVDFLQFKEGNDIREQMSVPEGERAQPYVVATYRYVAKDGSGETLDVVYDSDANTFTPEVDNAIWDIDTILEEKVMEDAYEIPIHDFMFLDANQNENFIDSFWKDEKKLLIVSYDLKKADLKSIKELKLIAAHMNEKGVKVWALTSNSSQEVEKFRHDNQISEFDFHYGDYTQLKSIIRSNPGLLLITDTSTVKRQWPSTRLPSIKKLDKLTR